MVLSGILLLVSMLSILAVDEGLAQTCCFPSFLQSLDNTTLKWAYNITRSYIVQYFMEVKDGLIVFTPYDNSKKLQPFNLNCVEQTRQNTFLVFQMDDNETAHYMCIEFIKRSPAVISIAKSKLVTKPSGDLCDDLHLHLHPLVAFESTYYQDCPQLGGYNVLISNRHQHILCKKDSYRYLFREIRLESGCGNANHGYKPLDLDFKECSLDEFIWNLGDLSKEVLYCRAQWRQGNYAFVIMTRTNEPFSNWVLRYPNEHGNLFNAQLMSEVQCSESDVMEDTNEYVTLHLDKEEVTSLCQDASKDCGLQNKQFTCNSRFRSDYGPTYCKKTCSDCHENDAISCDFGPLNGSWVIPGRSSFTSVNLGEVPMIRPLGNLFCIINQKYQPDRFNEYFLAKYLYNGCFPRMYCLTIISLTPSVMAFRMFLGPKWPEYNINQANGFIMSICSKKGNEAKTLPFFSQYWTLAFRQGHVESKSCGLLLKNYTIHAIFSSHAHHTVNCTGSMYFPQCDTGNAEEFVVELNTCSGGNYKDYKHFRCVADVPTSVLLGRLLLVHETISDTFYCIYIPSNFTTLKILSIDNCNDYGIRDFNMEVELRTYSDGNCTKGLRHHNVWEMEHRQGIPLSRGIQTSGSFAVGNKHAHLLWLLLFWLQNCNSQFPSL